MLRMPFCLANAARSRLTLERQSTVVPKTSKTQALMFRRSSRRELGSGGLLAPDRPVLGTALLDLERHYRLGIDAVDGARLVLGQAPVEAFAVHQQAFGAGFERELAVLEALLAG